MSLVAITVGAQILACKNLTYQSSSRQPSARQLRSMAFHDVLTNPEDCNHTLWGSCLACGWQSAVFAAYNRMRSCFCRMWIWGGVFAEDAHLRPVALTTGIPNHGLSPSSRYQITPLERQ